MKLPVASHTFLRDWENCPWKAFRRYIRKDLPKFVHTDATRWGDEVHTAFEVRIKHGTKFPAGMEKFEAIAAPLAAYGARAELSAGITSDGCPCNFFDSAVYLRGKLDCSYVWGDNDPDSAIMFDWKTGKKREDRAELATHAVLLKALHPTLQTITAHYVWLQDNEVGKAHDVSDTETKLAEIRSMMNTVENCMAIEDFPKRRNPLCGYCPVEDCEFNTVRR